MMWLLALLLAGCAETEAQRFDRLVLTPEEYCEAKGGRWLRVVVDGRLMHERCVWP